MKNLNIALAEKHLLSELTLAPCNRWVILSILKKMTATTQKLWNVGQHFRKEQTLNFCGRLLLSKLKCQNSMTDTHLALTKSDSGFWKIEKTRKNEHKFLLVASMIMIRLRNDELMVECFKEFHRSMHTLSIGIYIQVSF